MHKPTAIRALGLAGLMLPAIGLAQSVPSADPPAAAQATPARGGIDLLVRQAEHWLGQDRADLAALSIERALAADPRNPSALAVAARVEAARNNRAAAASYLAQLREVGGTAEQQAQVDSAVRGAAIDRGALEAARQLARDGRPAEAAARYRALFGTAGPPQQFALEYYQTLAGTDAGAEEGRRGLSRIAERPDADPRARLSYAQTLTYQPATRAEGIRRLAELVDQPAVADEARRAWRQALIWNIADPASASQVEAFLQRFPDDADLRRRAEAARSAPGAAPDPGFAARQEGFTRLEAGGLRDANRQFEAALATNPDDADALGGLGIVRLREGRQAEARTLLERAIAADPARAPQWQRALDGASYGAELAEGRSLLRAGKLDEADEVLRRAIRREAEDKTDAEVLLGELALKRRDPVAAEQRFRAALARRPGFAPAQTGLNQSLRAQGRASEVVAVATPRGAQSSANAQVAEMRAEAARSGDPAVAAAMLRNAIAIAPNDPWARLDLARALRQQGRGGEGRALVEELVVRDGNAESLMAAALLAEEDSRPADAEAFLNRIPPGRRTADMARLQQRARTQAEITRAASMLGGGRGEGRQQLLMLAARPDPTGGTAVAVIRAFADAGDRYGAAEAGRIAQTVNRTGGPRVQVAIAGALLAAGLEAEAAALADAADRPNLPADQRRDLASLRTGIAIRAADRLNEAGDQAQAFERLRPALANNPDSPEVRLALARLYQGASQPAEALRVTEAVLMRDPRDLDARRSAVDAAITLRDRERAEALVAEGLALAPNDSRATVLEARVAQAFGQTTRARRALETASAQRQRELGRPAAAAAGNGAMPVAWAGLENPFATGGTPGGATRQAVAPNDAISRDIAAQRAALEEARAVRVIATVGGRSRSGTTGIDELQELSGSLEASAAPPALPGRVTATISPVSLDGGRLSADPEVRRLLGSNLLGGGTNSRGEEAQGVGLSLAYAASDRFKIDVGTTPLGFHTTNIVGGVEIAPVVGDNLRFRLTAERRAVAETMLSWAGMRDTLQGRTWGGVTRTGGRGQVEIPVGRGYVYAGGGYARYEGDQVAGNSRVEGGAGFGYPVIREGDTELTAGLDLVYFAFDQNLRYFTYGQGGYYSPQSYAAINIPVDYRSRSGNLSYRVGGTIGYVNWREDDSKVFPNDPGLQARAEALAQADSTVSATYRGQSKSGLIGSLRADLDYALTPQLTLGGGLRYDKAADFDETRVLMRLNNRF